LEEIKLNFPSPVDTISIDGASFFIKRDDLIDSDFSGNKARKLHYFLNNDFPNINKLISYGSNQSNAMYSMSVLAKMKDWEFEYYTDHIPDFLINNPHGNYAKALENGMKLSVIPAKAGIQHDTDPRVKHEDDKENMLYINEGGRNKEAAWGVEILADEIIDQVKAYGFDKIFLPSGTGATALLLQRSLMKKGSPLKVYTTPCVGGKDYLIKQFQELETDQGYYPTILGPRKKYHFGKLYKELYIIWLKLQKQTNIEFDLLYDPIGWSVIFDNMEIFAKNTLYIHQGGLLGNVSMLERYKRKYKDEK
jgi:1-aminocyclopropane-1-carboxylate deaminase